jgi:hypothetical protein
MTIKRINASVSVQGVLIYALSFAVLAVLIFADSGFVSNDDYYHTRVATQIIEQQRLAIEFSWLPLTILNQQAYVDHHLLFHLYLAPFAWFGGMTGAKLATVAIAAGVFLAVWLLLREMKVTNQSLWTLALLGLSSPFLTRLLMVRTQGAALLLLLVLLLLLFKERYRWLIVIGFAFAWLYNGFVLIIAFAAIYSVSVWLAERRIVWQPVVYCAMGVGLGLVINPYFPHNVQFAFDHLGAKVDFSSGIRVGDEWYPYDTAEFLKNSTGALVLMTFGVLLPGMTPHRRDRYENTLLFAALLTLFMVVQSKRFIEYFPPFALLFCASAWGRTRFELPILLQERAFQFGMKVVAAAAVLLLIVGVLPPVYDRVQNAKDAETYAGASQWLAQNAEPGTVVFQTDWDDFTRLFYYNPRNVYISGLDPTYFQLQNPELWQVWEHLRDGDVPNPSEFIGSKFGARFVVSDKRHNDFERRAKDDPNMALVYEDQYSYVWEILSAESVKVTLGN